MMINNQYSWVKGFNFQPDWGTCGVTIWLNFDPARYREMLQAGKKAFPSFNTFRELLSFDAWIENRDLYLQNLAAAAKIITEEKLNFVPCYFNGWMSQPNFGGFTAENLDEAKNRVYQHYLEDCLAVLKDAPVLVHDVANEPYNNVRDDAFSKRVSDFLVRMCNCIHACDSRPVTVGSQFFIDIPEVDAAIDVVSLHPYNITNRPLEEFDAYFVEKLAPVEKSGKPVIITECVWGALDEEGRKPFLETELPTFKKYGIGFLCHALCVSPVADLHPADDTVNTDIDLYMAFLDKDFHIRKYHDLFNRL